MSKHCNKLTTLGHGEGARCGQQYYSEIYQCGDCAKKELIAARFQLGTLNRLLRIVAADPHRAWQIVEEIDTTLKQIEGLENANQIPSAD